MARRVIAMLKDPGNITPTRSQVIGIIFNVEGIKANASAARTNDAGDERNPGIIIF